MAPMWGETKMEIRALWGWRLISSHGWFAAVLSQIGTISFCWWVKEHRLSRSPSVWRVDAANEFVSAAVITHFVAWIWWNRLLNSLHFTQERKMLSWHPLFKERINFNANICWQDNWLGFIYWLRSTHSSCPAMQVRLNREFVLSVETPLFLELATLH